MFSHSSFWLGDRNFQRLGKSSDLDSMELARYKRSIAKFVRILTKENIPVTFRTQGSSHTDGENVILSSTITQKNFDSIVGLALHEGSHIVLTDFDVLPNYTDRVRKMVSRIENSSNNSDIVNKWVSELTMNRDVFQSLLNYVEDRRIDYYVYTNSPGYKPYYEAMYDRYFNDNVIDKAIASDEYTDLTFESYMFRIINFLNENKRLDVLPDLDKMYNLIFSNVSSISSTEESLEIAFKIYKLIKKNVTAAEKEEGGEGDKNKDEDGDGNKKSKGSNSPSNESSDENGAMTSMDGEGDDVEDFDSSSSGSETDDGSDFDEIELDDESSEDTNNNSNELTERQKGILPKRFKKQRKFLDGKTQKSTVSESEKKLIDNLSDTDIDDVEVSYENEYNGTYKENVAVIHGLNENSFNIFPKMGKRRDRCKRSDRNPDLQEYVEKGISLGKRLGKKLQIRNRDRTTTYNRQKKGKLDKRRIHALGHNSYNVFNQYKTEKHKDAFIHLSIDGSGSMSGTRFQQSILSAVAIAKMADMTNIEIEISIRYATSLGGGKDQPIIWIVYDSRKDKFQTIQKYFKYLVTLGTTPEGLCFESIMDQLPVGRDALKTYFINYSDGEPYYNDYSGEPAFEHTRKQVKKMESYGYKILSFFLGYNRAQDGVNEAFKKMYGKSASSIDPTELNGLVKTLQKMFMKK